MDVLIGALAFGLVMGWVTYRTLRRREGAVALFDIATVFGAVGGAAVTVLFADERVFAWYSIGLVVGFLAYFIVGLVLYGKEASNAWMGN